ncbi:MAG TPA: cupin domain-containing protein [archaeon]|nr:cupin domain-containing protein [archaeon]
MGTVYRHPGNVQPTEVVGEEIFELLAGAEFPFGSVKAVVTGSIPHYHERTHELYIVTKGMGKVLVQTPDNFLRIYFVEDGGVLYIPPGTKHAARGMKVGGKIVPFEVNVVSYPPWTQADHHSVDLDWPRDERRFTHVKHEQRKIA